MMKRGARVKSFLFRERRWSAGSCLSSAACGESLRIHLGWVLLTGSWSDVVVFVQSQAHLFTTYTVQCVVVVTSNTNLLSKFGFGKSQENILPFKLRRLND